MGLTKYHSNDYKPVTFRNFVENFFKEDFGGGSMAAFTPKADIAETDSVFEIHLHIPGMKKEEVRIDLHEDQLFISGERKMEEEKKEKNFHSIESYYGSFRRSFHLPDVVNQEKVDASYKDGILVIGLPKDEKKNTRKQIAIK